MYKAKRKSKTAGKPRTYNGKTVVDATSDIPFHVTDQDVSKGKANDACECAGALAIKRDHPGQVREVYLHRNIIMVELATKVIRYRTPGALRDQLLRYDSGNKFSTGTYRLAKVPASVIRNRGRQHSPPDRTHGAKDSPHARKKGIKAHDVGRPSFHFNLTNSEFGRSA
ncbi:MAG TPA: hypothetical protein VHT68_05320 [Pseudolabrys sp.]|jgi:hypothetical protein|nr:hypothetical protein [Pseudolabrys sp.]